MPQKSDLWIEKSSSFVSTGYRLIKFQGSKALFETRAWDEGRVLRSPTMTWMSGEGGTGHGSVATYTY